MGEDTTPYSGREAVKEWEKKHPILSTIWAVSALSLFCWAVLRLW